MKTTKGPLWVTSDLRTINGEDHLGIRYTAIIYADKLQTGITSITPRARYWSFFSWVLHDFIQNGPVEKNNTNFKKFLKRQEWFYILANIAEAEARNTNTSAVIGSTKGYEAWCQETNQFSDSTQYIKNSFGGYAVYRNVMKIVGLTKEADLNMGVHIDRLTSTGKKLAEQFEKSISKTKYYQEYRLANSAVPRSVLLEYGQVSALACINTTGALDKEVLRDVFLPEDTKKESEILRRNSLNYYKYVTQQYNMKKLSFMEWRKVMYDYTCTAFERLPEQYRTVAKGWEIYQARQLFTYSLESIWSYVLDQIQRKTYTENELIGHIIEAVTNKNVNLDKVVGEYIDSLPLDNETREIYVKDIELKEKDSICHVWQPLQVMLEVYNRIKARKDFEPIHNNLIRLGGRDNISLQEWESRVNDYLEKPISELLGYIIKYYVLQQHQNVAINKMVTTNNETFHFIEENGKLEFIQQDNPTFNTFRVFQGISILKDLGELQEN